MEELKLWKDDPWLEPWKKQLWERYSSAVLRRLQITGYGNTLESRVNGYLWYGCHGDGDGGFFFREWAPNATAVYLLAEVNGWKRV
jgi:1,4-alpha-glucan branching enzyme